MYLGSEPMGELLEGENGSDVIQVPLKRTILRTNGAGKEVELTMSTDSLIVKFLNLPGDSITNRLVLPVDMLAYCGALRQLAPEKIRNREFETLDKSPPDSSKLDPPLFVTIFRSLETENTLYCHSFVIGKDEEAMELVKLVMEIYYNLIRLQELEENNFIDNNTESIHRNENSSSNKNVNYNPSARSPPSSYYPNHSNNEQMQHNHYNQHQQHQRSSSRILNSNQQNDNIYMNNSCLNSSLVEQNQINKPHQHQQHQQQPTNGTQLTSAMKHMETLNLNDKEAMSNDYINKLIDEINANRREPSSILKHHSKDEVVSAKEIMQNEYEQSQNNQISGENRLECEKYNDAELNSDSNPIVIRKENNQQVVYKQNVFIRWLQPPTPPPPAPIIIREVQEPSDDSLPPLVIYKQAPRPKTPPPLIIRERPPSPLTMGSNEPLVIERRVMGPERQRKVIIEHLPAPPPKPRDIILEKWLPKETSHQQRQVYLQKGSSMPHHHHHHQKHQHQHHHQQQLYNHQHQQQQQQQQQQYVYSKPIYEDFDDHKQRRDIYEIMDKQARPSGATKASKKPIRRSNSNEMIYSPHKTYAPHSVIPTTTTKHASYIKQSSDLYSSQHQLKKPKVAGYRVIRQIIPGPNSTQADIEKVLSRGSSQYATNTNSNNKVILTKQPTLIKGSSQPYGQMIMKESKREVVNRRDHPPSPLNSFYANSSVTQQSPYRKGNNSECGSSHRSTSIDKF